MSIRLCFSQTDNLRLTIFLRHLSLRLIYFVRLRKLKTPRNLSWSDLGHIVLNSKETDTNYVTSFQVTLLKFHLYYCPI